MNEVKNALKQHCNTELIRYYVQKEMFCGNSNCSGILDFKTAVAIKGDRYIVLCGKCWDKIPSKDKASMEKHPKIEIIKYDL